MGLDRTAFANFSRRVGIVLVALVVLPIAWSSASRAGTEAPAMPASSARTATPSPPPRATPTPLVTATSTPGPKLATLGDEQAIVDAIAGGRAGDLWATLVTAGHFTAPDADEKLALVGNIGPEDAVRWVIIGTDGGNWEVKGASAPLAYGFDTPPSYWLEPQRLDFDGDGRQEALVPHARMHAGWIANAESLYRWDGNSWVPVWGATTLEDNTSVGVQDAVEPYRQLYEAAWEWADLDDVSPPEIVLQEHITFYPLAESGMGADRNMTLGTQQGERAFRWDGEVLRPYASLGPAVPFAFLDSVSHLWLWQDLAARPLDQEEQVVDFAWSQDGRWLAWRIEGQSALWLHDLATDGRTVFSVDAEPANLAWTDRGQLAYEFADESLPPYAFDPGSGRQQVLAEFPAVETAQDWSPDGTRMVTTEGSNIWEIPITGETVLRHHFGFPNPEWVALAWAPDGSGCLAALAGGAYPGQVSWFRADGSMPVTLVATDGLRAAKWAPVGAVAPTPAPAAGDELRQRVGEAALAAAIPPDEDLLAWFAVDLNANGEEEVAVRTCPGDCEAEGAWSQGHLRVLEPAPAGYDLVADLEVDFTFTFQPGFDVVQVRPDGGLGILEESYCGAHSLCLLLYTWDGQDYRMFGFSGSAMGVEVYPDGTVATGDRDYFTDPLSNGYTSIYRWDGNDYVLEAVEFEGPDYQGPEGTVRAYYNAIQIGIHRGGHFRPAYAYLSQEFRQSHPYGDFAAGFASTVRVRVEELMLMEENAGSAQMETVVTATDEVEGDEQETTYSIIWHVVKEEDQWKLDRAQVDIQ